MESGERVDGRRSFIRCRLYLPSFSSPTPVVLMNARLSAVLTLFATATACARGTTTAASPVTPAAASVNALPAGVSDALIATGERLFNGGACTRCHGASGIGGQNGPSLVSGPWLHASPNVADIARVITAGVPKEQLRDQTRRFAMNPRGGPMALNDDQVRALAAYVWSISRRKS